MGWKEWEIVEESMMSKNQQALWTMIMPCMQVVNLCMGLTSDPEKPRKDVIDFEEYVRMKGDSKLSVLFVHCSQMRLAYLFNDYDKAERHWVGESKDLWLIP